MSLFTKLANAIFSPVDDAGNKRSVDNLDIQRWGTELERIIGAFQAGGGIIFPDLSTASSSLDYGPNAMAWVMGDPVTANNGIYRKVGASGSGSWVRLGDLPFSMIPLTNVGAGTADAIIAMAALPLPTTPGAAMLTVNILADNTGPVTINGKPLRTNSGNEISASGLTAGSMPAFVDAGDHYRLLSDQASAAIVAAAEEYALAAQEAMSSVVPNVFATKSAAQAYSPDVAPAMLVTAFRDSAQEPGSGSVYGDPSTTSHGTPDEITLTIEGVPYYWRDMDRIVKPRSISSNDDVALAAAFQVAGGRPIDLGGKNYTLTTPISHTLAGGNLFWRGDDAKIEFDPAAHSQTAVIIDAGGARRMIDIEGVSVLGGGMCNRALHIINNVADMDTSALARLRVNGTFGHVRRSNAFFGGDGLLVTGGFETVDLSGTIVRECVLPSGQGTPGAAGIRGIGVMWGNGGACWTRRVIADRIVIDGVYSEDLDYLYDQDGLAVFGPWSTRAGAWAEDVVTITNATFRNCFGRSIKTQTFRTDVSMSHFEHAAGLNGLTGPDIDIQVGSGTVEKCTVLYDGHVMGGFARIGSQSNQVIQPRGIIRANEVYFGAGTDPLPVLVSNAPDGGLPAILTVEDNKVHGELEHWVHAYVNSDRNFLDFNRNDCQELVPSTISAMTGERAAIVVRTSGGASPYYGYITATDNREFSGNLPAVVRDVLAGNSTNTTVSAYGNPGYAHNLALGANVSGLKESQVARIGRIGPAMSLDGNADRVSGFFEVQSKYIANGDSATFPVRTVNASRCMLSCEANRNCFADVVVDSTMAAFGTPGSAWNIGGTADPGSGSLRAWRSAAGEITIYNNIGSTRLFTVFTFCPG